MDLHLSHYSFLSSFDAFVPTHDEMSFSFTTVAPIMIFGCLVCKRSVQQLACFSYQCSILMLFACDLWPSLCLNNSGHLVHEKNRMSNLGERESFCLFWCKNTCSTGVGE